uniref:Cytochrome c domain-containing protein n=1 Tax=Solibacter usitatus (strain Ellin6076) TaxID=234267 RepID=Q01RF4_SOLUE
MKIVTVIGMILAGTLPALSQAPASDTTKGKELFLKYGCYQCHGYSGQNGPGKPLVPMKFGQAAFTMYLRNPIKPNQMNWMPSYSDKVLTNVQLGDIYAYIKTLPEAPAAEDIPLLNDIKAGK